MTKRYGKIKMEGLNSTDGKIYLDDKELLGVTSLTYKIGVDENRLGICQIEMFVSALDVDNTELQFIAAKPKHLGEMLTYSTEEMIAKLEEEIAGLKEFL